MQMTGSTSAVWFRCDKAPSPAARRWAGRRQIPFNLLLFLQ